MLSCIISFNSNNYCKFAIIIFDFLQYKLIWLINIACNKISCTNNWLIIDPQIFVNLFIIHFSNLFPFLYSLDFNEKKMFNFETPCYSSQEPMSISSLRSQNDIKLAFIVNVLENFYFYCQYILVRPQNRLSMLYLGCLDKIVMFSNIFISALGTNLKFYFAFVNFWEIERFFVLHYFEHPIEFVKVLRVIKCNAPPFSIVWSFWR